MRRTRQYFSSLTQDFPSAIVVSLVALPLCLGIALGSQAPLFSGLIGGVVGGIVVGFLSGSSLSVSGPAAGLTTIVAAAITTLPSYESFLVAVVIAGCFQMVLGLLKAGVIGDYVPGTVIKGMLAAIGLILVLKQFPHLIGYDKNYEGDEAFLQPDQQNTFSQISQAFRSISPLAVLIGVLSLLLQFVWENWKALQQSKWRMIPAPLLVVLLGVCFNEGFKSMGS
ncbi:MAG: SulP family inorganic anion transporter, partial [Chitinophagaceae bacterium]